MDLPTNAFKAALRSGKQQIGIWHSLSDPTVAELLAGCGYDWIMMDTEHSPVGPTEAIDFLRAVAPYPVAPVVRPSWNNPVEIKKLLDAGAQTLLIPYVRNAEEARAAVAAVTYPPKGIRGVSGITRATRYGAVHGYAKRANEEICLLVQVETREALDTLEEIATVDGVDGVFIGPADLAASFGNTGEPSHPEVKAAILDSLATLGRLGVPGGILSLDQDFLREAKAAGAQFIAVDVDSGLLRRAALARRDD
ncbi:MAG TPA: aldolase/citrate lyase family protein [Amaricoccus sp.]|uniref:HpcH/HpaI aldolase family protein n=1 Tax=Amaricoccus sp. TaxID=1872485 RepID=UPI002B5087C2|nr:aldolase/citrate lyase family protein [Amaricoccus sp.]HMQ95004.1 aldolase/citrate lyase family protein [Amaricoccus sp.]HMR37809.1 aldolase/citrate lyase family protein [Paracoccus sp. (in: a-proteobacteria)]HMR54807.1 aldolase/citrate lyase family protein [Amaricoccus sp.]HMU01849.1 aldolase/citrate lyase family protein [Amaricoccus sp.]